MILIFYYWNVQFQANNYDSIIESSTTRKNKNLVPEDECKLLRQELKKYKRSSQENEQRAKELQTRVNELTDANVKLANTVSNKIDMIHGKVKFIQFRKLVDT